MRPDPRRRKRHLVAVGVVAVMLLIGAALVAIGSPDPEPSSAPGHVDPTLTLVAVPLDDEPVGGVHDREAAVEAAVAYATAPQRWLYLTDAEIAEAVTAMATPAAAPPLSEQVVAEVGTARDALRASSGRVWWLVRPLAWQVGSFTDERATVSVWTVSVLSAEDVAAPQSDWTTITIDLVQIDGAWLVDGSRESPGPTPLPGPNDQPWDAAPFDDALAGFTRMDGEPVT